jgi:hypothetical protein
MFFARMVRRPNRLGARNLERWYTGKGKNLCQGDDLMSDANTISVEQSDAEDGLPLDLLFQALEGYRVVIDTHDHVRAYLKRFPRLIPHVLPTVERARREFGDAAELTLTINDDPESYDPYLKMYISLPSYGPDTMARIDSIQEPLDEATADLEGFFLVSTDHRLVGR